MAAVFVRLGCSNPTEPSSGRAVSLLHSNFEMTQLGDPQTFYNKVSDFKAAVKSLAKGADQPEVHLTLYSTPDALPPALYQKAYPEGGPAGVRRNSAARSLGPLRKSSSSIRLNTQQAGQQGVWADGEAGHADESHADDAAFLRELWARVRRAWLTS